MVFGVEQLFPPTCAVQPYMGVSSIAACVNFVGHQAPPTAITGLEPTQNGFSSHIFWFFYLFCKRFFSMGEELAGWKKQDGTHSGPNAAREPPANFLDTFKRCDIIMPVQANLSRM